VLKKESSCRIKPVTHSPKLFEARAACVVNILSPCAANFPRVLQQHTVTPLRHFQWLELLGQAWFLFIQVLRIFIFLSGPAYAPDEPKAWH
jgi:hypothetical protein